MNRARADIDDPIFLNAGAGVEWRLEPQVFRPGRYRDLDDQHRIVRKDVIGLKPKYKPKGVDFVRVSDPSSHAT